MKLKMELIKEKIQDVSVLRRMIFACSFLPKHCPMYWELVSKFAVEGSKEMVDATTCRVLMENLELINPKAFSQDQELTKEIVSMSGPGNDKQAMGVILISPNNLCLLCQGNLLVRADRPSRVTLYTDSMGTVPASHYSKYCNRSRYGCKFIQHYGYYSKGGSKHFFFNHNWKTHKYFVSTQETAFELSLLLKFDVELLVGQISYNQKADIYNLQNGYDATRKICSAQQSDDHQGTSQAVR